MKNDVNYLGQYIIKYAAPREDIAKYHINSLLDLALVKCLFVNLEKYGELLPVDARRRAKWTDIRKYMAEFSSACFLSGRRSGRRRSVG